MSTRQALNPRRIAPLWAFGAVLAAATGLALTLETRLAAEPPLRTVHFAVLTPGLATAHLEFAQERGVFRRHGILLDIHYFYHGGAEGNAAIAGGAIDAGTYGPPALVGIVRGLPIKVVAAPTHPEGAGEPLLARAGIHSVKDLKGKIVGSSAAGQGPYEQLQTILEANGLSIKDVKPVLGSVQALAGGQVDAITSSDFEAAWAVSQGIGHVIDHSSKYLKHYQSSSVFATDRFIAENPELLRSLILSLLEARSYSRDHFDAYYQFTREKYGRKYDPKLLRAYLLEDAKTWNYDGRFDKKEVWTYLRWIVGWGDLRQSELDSVHDSDLFDLRFLPKKGV